MDEISTQQPKRFSDIMANPQRKCAEGALAAVILQLEREQQIATEILADVLFEYAIMEATHKMSSTGSKAVQAYHRLKRFHKELDDILNHLSAACEAQRAKQNAEQ